MIFLRDKNVVAELFNIYSTQWKKDCLIESSVAHMAMHPDYQRIIGLGLQALPEIFNDLQQKPDHWFWALNAIVGHDIAEGTETIEEASTAWLKWGKEHGYLEL